MPNRTDYELVVQALDRFALDETLKSSKVIYQSNGFAPKVYSGGRAVIYPVKTAERQFALKCWIQNLGELADRYKAINSFLEKTSYPYMVNSIYLESELLVNGDRHPVVRMDWVEASTLKQWIGINIDNPAILRKLADDFHEMVRSMHGHAFSHGDLQHENIMVKPDGSLVLVDYDSLFLPGLEHLKDEIKGLPGFQHPSRGQLSHCSQKVDYFSELVIYLSIKALALKPALWSRVEKENRLLFSEKDIVETSSSEVIDLLRSDTELKKIVDVFCDSCAVDSLDKLIPLEDVVAACEGVPSSKTRRSTRARSSSNLNIDQSGQIPEASSFSSDMSALRNFEVWRPSGMVDGHGLWQFNTVSSNGSGSPAVRAEPRKVKTVSKVKSSYSLHASCFVAGDKKELINHVTSLTIKAGQIVLSSKTSPGQQLVIKPSSVYRYLWKGNSLKISMNQSDFCYLIGFSGKPGRSSITLEKIVTALRGVGIPGDRVESTDSEKGVFHFLGGIE